MNDEKQDDLEPVEDVGDDTEEPTPAPEKPTPTLSPELMAAGRGDKPAWKSGSGPGRWTTIGCGLGIVVLVAALFAGSSLMRKTVWIGFGGTTQRVMNSLPGDLPPGERMQLKKNLDAFTAVLKRHEKPFPIMGEFQTLAKEALEDGVVARDEVAELNAFVESVLSENPTAVPYSMP